MFQKARGSSFVFRVLPVIDLLLDIAVKWLCWFERAVQCSCVSEVYKSDEIFGSILVVFVINYVLEAMF